MEQETDIYEKIVLLQMQLTYYLEKYDPEAFRATVMKITKQSNQNNNGKEQGIHTSTAQETE